MTTLAPPPLLPPYNSSQPARLNGQYQQYNPETTLHPAHARRERGPSRFADGLPTPPEVKAMTDVYYHNGQPPHFIDRNFYQLPFNTQPGHKQNNISWNPPTNGKVDGLAINPDTSRAPNAVKDVSYEPAQKSTNESIASFLRIPEAIDRKGGSLTELAAEVIDNTSHCMKLILTFQITCLFWFESATTLQNIEQSPADAPYTKILAPDTTPTMGFRKWVTTILATTQVTRNVIILALLFIYRLKKSNPQVSGKQGSEFRLLTIALMLGNKFLDDNTYTNKTWAEVSGISVSEIHVMEVEFLSNMRYNLYVSSEEWEDWMVKLGKFRVFLFESSRVSVQRTMALNTPTPLTLPQHKLPSPPSPLHNEVQNYPTQILTPNSTAMPRSQRASPVRSFPDSILGPRKRSLDVSSEEPPAKRGMQSLPASTVPSRSATAVARLPSIYTPTSSAPFTPAPETSYNAPAHASLSSSGIPRLPMPRIQTNLDPVTASVNPWNNQLPLPNGRAMSSVYPSNSSWTQPTTPTSTIPSGSLNPYHNSAPTIPDTSQAGTPFSVRSVHGSPVSHNFHTLTPTTHLSPSVFLNNRNSPYRPIRAVNTLLYPPPSTSLQNPSRNIPFDQMHYQPLSKQSAERKVGVVPYLQQDPWSVPYPVHPNVNSTRTYSQSN